MRDFIHDVIVESFEHGKRTSFCNGKHFGNFSEARSLDAFLVKNPRAVAVFAYGCKKVCHGFSVSLGIINQIALRYNLLGYVIKINNNTVIK